MITGCGAPGIKGTLFSLRNNPDGTEIYTVGVDMDDRAVGKYFVDAFYVVPGPEDGQYIDALLNICTAENADVIIPQTTRELSVLSENKSCFERVGTAVMVSPFEAIDIANNKLKLFEYMSAGIPVVASNFPLWKEIVEGNNCGICVDPLKPKEIADAIRYLLEHSEEAKEMGENGRKAVEEKYNWETESKKLLQIYRELLQEDQTEDYRPNLITKRILHFL